MIQLILKRAPIAWNKDDYDVVEGAVIVGRIFCLDAVGPQGRPWMWGERPRWPDTPRGVRPRSNARCGDGGVREKLA
jgi:hypothetical protein